MKTITIKLNYEATTNHFMNAIYVRNVSERVAYFILKLRGVHRQDSALGCRKHNLSHFTTGAINLG
jgi:hypothetical protein